MTRHIRTPNAVTGRDTHIHLAMDKFTVAGVHRQAVNKVNKRLGNAKKFLHHGGNGFRS